MARGAGTGALIGGTGGALVGSSSSMGAGTGLLGGAAAGAVIGGIVGMVQDAKDRTEQDRLSQERSYQQDLAKRRAEDARSKASIDEELAVAAGLQISDFELNEARQKFLAKDRQLKILRDERAAALAKKKEFDESLEKMISIEAEIARMEEELSRLRGDSMNNGTRSSGGDMPVSQESTS